MWACLVGEHARTRDRADQQCMRARPAVYTHTSMLSKPQLERARKAIELLSSLPNTESATASKPEAAIKTEKGTEILLCRNLVGNSRKCTDVVNMMA